MNDFENDPYRSPMEVPSGDNGRGLITAVAVINYVFGGISLSCGLCTGVLGGGTLGMLLAGVGGGPPMDDQAKLGIGIASAIFIVMIAIQVLVGLLIILAGYGVQNYRQWGRILTIVLAVISGLMGVFGTLATKSGGFAASRLCCIRPGGDAEPAVHQRISLTHQHSNAQINSDRSFTMSNFDDPFRSPEVADAQMPEYDAQGANQGLLTTVCVLTYVLAAFNLLGGGLVIFGGAAGLLMGFPTAQPGAGGPPPQMLALVKYMMIAMIVIGVIFVLSSILAAITGYGLQIRRRWGYQLGLVMAACSGVETVPHVACLLDIGTDLHVLYDLHADRPVKSPEPAGV